MNKKIILHDWEYRLFAKSDKQRRRTNLMYAWSQGVISHTDFCNAMKSLGEE